MNKTRIPWRCTRVLVDPGLAARGMDRLIAKTRVPVVQWCVDARSQTPARDPKRKLASSKMTGQKLPFIAEVGRLAGGRVPRRCESARPTGYALLAVRRECLVMYSLSTPSMRDCQPSPVDLKYARTSGL